MTENSNHASGSYFFACHQGERSFSPETVFFCFDDDSLTSSLLGLLKKTYGGGERNPIFHAQAIGHTDEADQILLDGVIDELAKYDDPDPFVYESWPPRQTMLRASYAQRAESWVKMRLFRKENVSNHAKVQKLAEALKKLEEVTREFLSLSESLAYWHFPVPDLPAYRQALWEAEAHVDGISAYLECGPQSGQIETGLRETLQALSREVEDAIFGYYARVWVYQLPNEITAPARKAFDDFSRIYTELSQSGFKPDSDLFKNSTATKGHVDTPDGCCSLEEEREAAKEQRQMERAEWVRKWAELQGELKKARTDGDVFVVLQVLAKSIDQWAGELDSAVDDLFRRDADSVSRRRIICDRHVYDDDDDYEDDQPFLTVPFVGVSQALSMLEFSKEDVMAEGLAKRLGEIEEARESLCDEVVAEVRQWDDTRTIQLFPHLDDGRRSLQRKADACTEYIDDFVAVHQPRSNRQGMGSPSHNSDPPSLYPKIAGAPEQGARDETKPPHLEAGQGTAAPPGQGKKTKKRGPKVNVENRKWQAAILELRAKVKKDRKISHQVFCEQWEGIVESSRFSDEDYMHGKDGEVKPICVKDIYAARRAKSRDA